MKKLVFLFFVFSFTNTIQAQTTDNAQNSLLWRISGNGLEKPSYIFGTIHLIPKDDYFFTETMKEKFDSCENLVLEIDINLSLAEQINAAKQMMFPDGKTLKDYMTENEFSRFKTYLSDSLGIKESTFKQIQRIKPLFSSGLILRDLTGKTKTYEEEFNKRAKKNKMKISGLETLQFQMDLINNISIEDQVKMLLEDDMKTNPLDDYKKLLSFYKAQNLDSLKVLINSDDSMAELGDKFLKDRNADWISKIEKLISKNSSFIAVGAGHLAGNDGVLNLLRQKGYIIEPVK